MDHGHTLTGPPTRRRRPAWRQWRPLLLEKLPLVAVVLLFVVINLHTHQTGSRNYTTLPLLDRLSLIFPNYWDYLRQLALKITLILDLYFNLFKHLVRQAGSVFVKGRKQLIG